MKKKIEKKKKTYSVDHMGVMLENLISQFKVFGEGQELIIDRMNKSDVRLSTLEDKAIRTEIHILGSDANLKELKRDMKDGFKSSADYLFRVEENISKVNKNISGMKSDISGMKNDISEIKDRLNTVEVDVKEIKEVVKEKADKKDYDKLKKLIFAKT